MVTSIFQAAGLVMGVEWLVHAAAATFKGLTFGLGTVATALPQGAAAGWGSYIVGESARYYFEHGASWGAQGPKRVITQILENTDKRSVLQRLKERDQEEDFAQSIRGEVSCRRLRPEGGRGGDGDGDRGHDPKCPAQGPALGDDSFYSGRGWRVRGMRILVRPSACSTRSTSCQDWVGVIVFKCVLDDSCWYVAGIELGHFRLREPAPGVDDRQRAGQEQAGGDDALACAPRGGRTLPTSVSAGGKCRSFRSGGTSTRLPHEQVIRPPAWPISTGSLFPQLHSTRYLDMEYG